MRWLAVVLALGACASEDEFVRRTSLRRRDHVADAEAETIRKDGMVLNREVLAEDLGTVRRIAAFDFNCEDKGLELRVLSVHTTFAHTDWPNAIGVIGCGKRARYQRGEDAALSAGWKLAGAIAEDESQP
jgi:hypothetical protein